MVSHTINLKHLIDVFILIVKTEHTVLMTFVMLHVDVGWGNFFCIFAICSSTSWSSWGLVRLGTLYGLAHDSRIFQVIENELGSLHAG